MHWVIVCRGGLVRVSCIVLEMFLASLSKLLYSTSQTWQEIERKFFFHVFHRIDNYIVFALKMH